MYLYIGHVYDTEWPLPLLVYIFMYGFFFIFF